VLQTNDELETPVPEPNQGTDIQTNEVAPVPQSHSSTDDQQQQDGADDISVDIAQESDEVADSWRQGSVSV